MSGYLTVQVQCSSATAPNDSIQNDPIQLAEQQLQRFFVSKQLFHTLSRHDRSAVSQPKATSMWSVPIYLIWVMVDLIAILQNPSNASACPTENPLLLSFFGSVQLRPSAVAASGGCSWNCKTFVCVCLRGSSPSWGWPATKGDTPWIHPSKGQKEWHDKGNTKLNCQTVKTYLLRWIMCVLLPSHLTGGKSPAPSGIQSIKHWAKWDTLSGN